MAFAAAINSTGGLVVRSLEAADDWQVVFWRGLSLGVAILVIVFYMQGKAVAQSICSIGWTGVSGGLFFCGALTFYVLSLTHTTVANTVFTMSAIPFFTALLAWFIIGEQINRAMLLAIFMAMGGIAIMVGNGVNNGALSGNLMAIGAALSFAFFVVVLRKGRTINMLPTTMVGALVAACFALFMTGGNIRVSNRDLALCLFWGATISSASHFLMVKASRFLSGAHLSLLVLLEFVLAPVWVFLFVDEVPDTMTLVGGAVVLAAVSGHTIMSMRKMAGQAG
jgi:drug/metabolite transporter (DMT)-like permease